MPLITLPPGHGDLRVVCRCPCKGNEAHYCFALGSPKLRGFCPPCFEAKVVEPVRNEADALHKAYHAEMTRINGWRIRNEGSFERGMRRVDEYQNDWKYEDREPGGPPYPRGRDEDIA